MNQLKIKSSTYRIWQLCACGSLLLSSCSTVPSGDYASLNQSTEKVATTSNDTYSRFIELERLYDVLKATKGNSIDRDTFEPLKTAKGNTYRSELEKREAALTVVANYTKVLAAFASKDYRSAVDAAATKLSASVKSLAGTLDSASANSKGVTQGTALFGTLVSEIGGLVSEHERLVALKQIMTDAQTPLSQITLFLIQDNSELKIAIEALLGKSDGILASYNRLVANAQGADRIALYKEAAATMAEADEMEMALDGMNAALKKIPPAHQQLRDHLDKKAGAVDELTNLIKEADRADKFYKTLNK
jgi:hypothetical protein